MKLFAIESSAKVASAAICEEERMLCQMYLDVGLTHSCTLLPMVNQLLQSCRLSFSDIDALAVTCGPGSFTGLRIGLSTVKGIGQATGKKCYPVSTLEALAYNFRGVYQGVVCCAMDARCNQVYHALFEIKGRVVNRLCEDRPIGLNQLKEDLKEKKEPSPILLAGDGADLCFHAFAGEINIQKAPPHLLFSQASSVAFAAFSSQKPPLPVEELTPVYLRLSQAERMKMEKEKMK